MNSTHKIIIVILTLLLIISLFMNSCNKDKEKEVVTKVVTKRFRTVDTVFFTKTKVETLKVFITIPDTVYITNKETGLISEQYGYTNPYEDSLIKGNITSLISDKGKLLNQQLIYSPKFPQYIRIKDSVVVEINTPRKTELYFGGDVGVAPSYVIMKPKVGLHLKNNFSVDLGYDIINKGYHIGVTKTIRRK